MKPSAQRTIRLAAPDFSLGPTLRSAQLFRARPENEGYVVHAGARRITVRQANGTLDVAGATEAFVRHFFALDERYEEIAARLSHCPELTEAIEACRGIRIMRQDPWECLVGFVCSQCCNVPRIERMVRALCEAAGAQAGKDARWRAFPDPGGLPAEAALRRLGVGYRAAYLSRLNAPWMRHWLHGLRLQGFESARDALRSLPGVGEKVADCVLLYSLGFRQAFPVDVWIRRAMQETHFGGRRAPDRDIQKLAADRFGRDAGYAQLFLFHHWRTRKIR